MKVKAYSADGRARSKGFELPGAVFDGTVHEGALHQVITASQARRRQGTAATKNRAAVSGGGRKPWRQKGTGRARAGTIRSPLWRGGGKVFGPEPRAFAPRMPRKLRRLAIRSALNARAMEGDLVVVDELEIEKPHTKTIVQLLDKIAGDARNVLILTHGPKETVYRSAHNIPGVQVSPWGDSSAYDLLWADRIVVEAAALAVADEAGGEESESEEEEE